VAIHPRLFKRGERSTVDDHLPPEAQVRISLKMNTCFGRT
jgi:hypothetical protein